MILGLAYKPNVGDIQGESPVVGLVEEYQTRDKIRIWDPMVTSEIELPDGVKMVNDPYQGAAGTGMVVLATRTNSVLSWAGRIRDIVSEAKLFDGPRSLDRDLMESVGFSTRGWEFQMSRFLKSIRAILPYSSNKAEASGVFSNVRREGKSSQEYSEYQETELFPKERFESLLKEEELGIVKSLS